MSETGLYLVTPVLAEAEPFLPLLAEATAAVELASVLLRLAPSTEAFAVRLIGETASLVQAHGVALLIDGDPALALAAGADGVHVTGAGTALDAAIKRLSPDFIVGAGGLPTRHDAMVAGEAGADYLLFGDCAAPLETAELEERVRWWTEIFSTPCVAFAHRLEQIAPLAAAGADFVMLGDCVWDDPRGPAAALMEARRALAPQER
jgi:thiamine-phosphate pyrophosphorylase